jgi:hypothetical protein
MADNLKQSNVRRQLGNKIILLAIMSALLVVPGYIGVSAAFVLYYGEEYFNAVYAPSYLIEQYKGLFNYWPRYCSQ